MGVVLAKAEAQPVLGLQTLGECGQLGFRCAPIIQRGLQGRRDTSSEDGLGQVLRDDGEAAA